MIGVPDWVLDQQLVALWACGRHELKPVPNNLPPM